jgi:uncharacterized protein
MGAAAVGRDRLVTRRVFCSLTAAAALGQERARVLLLTGLADEPYHKWRETTPQVAAALARFDVRLIEDARALTGDALKGAAALVVNYNGPRLSRDTEAAVEAFVRGGGGLVAFHHASYGEWFGMVRRNGRWSAGPGSGWAGWAELIGATWRPENIGHSVRHVFTAEWTDPAHPICSGKPVVANDELYHKLDLKPQARVLLAAHSDPKMRGTGRREPVAWTTTPGRGRVFFTTLGHDASALYQSGVQQMFARAVEWAATGRVVASPVEPAPLRLLVVTSGHTYPPSFYEALHSMAGIDWSHAASHAEIPKNLVERFDALLLHDMHDEIAPAVQERLRSFVEAGKGVVQLHHAVVNYTSWPWWWQQVTGGKYFVKPYGGHKKSSYRHDVEFAVIPVTGKESHPVLAGVGPLWVYDELYKDMWHSPDIEVLMETAHEGNDRPVVYVGPYRNARVVYIQLGHSEHTMKHPGFRRLLRNAIFWTSGKEHP